MAKLQVLHLDNTSAGEMEFSDSIAETLYHPYIIKDAVVEFRAGIRQGTHATKDRGDVAGSNVKPWRQKGTGRARAGCTRSPLWRHGGTVFGPHPRDYSIKINKKVRKKALQSAFAEKMRNQQILILDDLQLESHKTKTFKQSLDQLGCSAALVVVDDMSKNLVLASRNIPGVQVITHRSLNVYQLLRYEKVIIAKEALAALEKRLLS
ncbi:50S ribosomal protein L4 [Deltaproteobacteria bacterium TL4]